MFIPPWPYWIFVAGLVIFGLLVDKQNKRDDLLLSLRFLTLPELVAILHRPNLQREDHELWKAAILAALPLYENSFDREQQCEFELAVGHTVEARALEVINKIQRGEMSRVRLTA